MGWNTMKNKFIHKTTLLVLILSIIIGACLFIYVFYRPSEILINQYLFKSIPKLIDLKKVV